MTGWTDAERRLVAHAFDGPVWVALVHDVDNHLEEPEILGLYLTRASAKQAVIEWAHENEMVCLWESEWTGVQETGDQSDIGGLYQGIIQLHQVRP